MTWTTQLIYTAAGLTDEDTAALAEALGGADIAYAADRLQVNLEVEASTLEEAAASTLRTAAARLRSSWRAACPLETDADGRQHRKTGTHLPHPDWWAGNRLAILAWRLKWYRQPGGFKSPPPPHDHHSEIHGQRRKAQ